MPRPKATAPKYEFHISGQARVRFCGKDYYLGAHGSPESLAKYHHLVAEYLANGQKPPEIPNSSGGDKEHLEDHPVTIKTLTADFRHRKLSKYEHNEAQHTRFSNLCDLLDSRHGDETPDQFGPLKLEAIRDKFISDGLSRRYINTKVKMIRQIFTHGVSREIVKAHQIIALKALEPLSEGEARESEPRHRVTLEEVKATLEHLAPHTANMVKLQLYTAMRPSEMFSMTPGQIDRSGATWFYRPLRHKTSKKKKVRAIALNAHAIEIITPLMFGDPDALMFETYHGTKWNRNSYRQAIKRAAELAKVPHWTPYSLRHLAAQIIRNSLGAEAVQAGLGHSRIDMAETYSSATEALAAKAAAVIPAVG